MSEEGGTRIQRNRQGPPVPQQMMQQQQAYEQPNFQQPSFQQQVPQQMMQQQQQVPQQVPRSILKKSSFGSKIDFDSPSLKQAMRNLGIPKEDLAKRYDVIYVNEMLFISRLFFHFILFLLN